MNRFIRQRNENPLYGMRNLLNLNTEVGKLPETVAQSTVYTLLNNAYGECQTPQQRAVFYSLVFAMGDVPNREHNLLKRRSKNAPEGGGYGKRKAFLFALKWMLEKDESTREQFYRFLPLIGEYTNWENLFYNQIRTDRYKGTVTEQLSLPVDLNRVAGFVARLLQDPRTPDVTLQLWAKWLKAPSFKARRRTYTVTAGKEKWAAKKTGRPMQVGETFTMDRPLQKATVEKERREKEFIELLSQKMGWQVGRFETNVRYYGLEAFKKKHNRRSEAYLFSTKQVLQMDAMQFIEWLDQLPAGARFRVQCRLFDKDKAGKLVKTTKWVGKYGNLADFYQEYLNQKESAQQQVRELEVKAAMRAKHGLGLVSMAFSQNDLTDEELAQYKELKKVAKVNTGAIQLGEVATELLSGGKSRQELMVTAEQLLNNMNLQVPVLIFGDRSGSMQQRYSFVERFTPFDVMTLLVTAFLTKNPDPEAASMFGLFSSECTLFQDGTQQVQNTPNRWTVGQTREIHRDLIDRSQPFIDNWEFIRQLCHQHIIPHNTDLQAISRTLNGWVNQYPDLKSSRIEAINRFPVWMMVSDTEFNNQRSVQHSLTAFRQDMLQNFGWDGLVVLWDVSGHGKPNDFSGIENVIHLSGSNVSVLNQVFTNLHNLDVVDVYSPLQALLRSERYAPVREAVDGYAVIETTSLQEVDI